MKSILSIVLFTIAAIISSVAQEREERKIDAFEEIKVGQAIKVRLHHSNEEKVIIESSNVDLDEIETKVRNGILYLSLDGNNYRNISVSIDVYYRNLKGLSASSASSVKSERTISGGNFQLGVSSAASVDIILDVNNLQVDVSSAADAKLSGKTHELNAEVSSAGGINAYDLEAEIVNASASSAGSAKINVTNSLHARASSGGSIRYKGNPARSNTDSSSGGSVKKSG
ncbi:MAG: head GIN domain-containing protein [Candidatus Cyclobacteriaceae bacterium M2_1C_046]